MKTTLWLKPRKGFTLSEGLVTLGVIGIVSAVTVGVLYTSGTFSSTDQKMTEFSSAEVTKLFQDQSSKGLIPRELSPSAVIEGKLKFKNKFITNTSPTGCTLTPPVVVYEMDNGEKIAAEQGWNQSATPAQSASRSNDHSWVCSVKGDKASRLQVFRGGATGGSINTQVANNNSSNRNNPNNQNSSSNNTDTTNINSNVNMTVATGGGVDLTDLVEVTPHFTSNYNGQTINSSNYQLAAVCANGRNYNSQNTSIQLPKNINCATYFTVAAPNPNTNYTQTTPGEILRASSNITHNFKTNDLYNIVSDLSYAGAATFSQQAYGNIGITHPGQFTAKAYGTLIKVGTASFSKDVGTREVSSTPLWVPPGSYPLSITGGTIAPINSTISISSNNYSFKKTLRPRQKATMLATHNAFAGNIFAYLMSQLNDNPNFENVVNSIYTHYSQVIADSGQMAQIAAYHNARIADGTVNTQSILDMYNAGSFGPGYFSWAAANILSYGAGDANHLSLMRNLRSIVGSNINSTNFAVHVNQTNGLNGGNHWAMGLTENVYNNSTQTVSAIGVNTANQSGLINNFVSYQAADPDTGEITNYAYDVASGLSYNIMTHITPIKINLNNRNAELNSTDYFLFDWDGFNRKNVHPFMTPGGLNNQEAWLAYDANGNGTWKDNKLDNDDLFGDHFGQFTNGYSNLEYTFNDYIKIDEKGEKYISLENDSFFDWLGYIGGKITGNKVPNATFDLKLITQSKQTVDAKNYVKRIYVSAWNTNEYDKEGKNAILFRAKILNKNGSVTHSADQYWFVTDGIQKIHSKEETAKVIQELKRRGLLKNTKLKTLKNIQFPKQSITPKL